MLNFLYACKSNYYIEIYKMFSKPFWEDDMRQNFKNYPGIVFPLK